MIIFQFIRVEKGENGIKKDSFFLFLLGILKNNK